jgi:hypothetical protein
MAKNGTLTGLRYEDIDWNESSNCLVCTRSNVKQFRVPRKANRQPGIPFHTGSIDLWGPVNIPSVGGNKYAMVYCDNQTSYGFIDFVAGKDLETICSPIKRWKLTISNLGYDLKILQMDSDPIFENTKFQEFLQKIGIEGQYAPPGKHQANGLVERMIQTIVSMTRAMLLASQLDLKYWTYAMSYAMMIYNATLKSRFKRDDEGENYHQYHSPYYMVRGSKPIYDFPIFGCLVVSRKPTALQIPKLFERGTKGCFLGFDPQHHGCVIILSTISKQIIYSDDATIFEEYYGINMSPTDYHRLKTVVSSLDDEEILDIESENVEESELNDSSIEEEIEEESSKKRKRTPKLKESEPVRVQPHRSAKQLKMIQKEYSNEMKIRQKELSKLFDGYGSNVNIDELLTYKLNPESTFIDGNLENLPQSYDEARSEMNLLRY